MNSEFLKLRQKVIDNFFSRMNPMQKEAVLHTDGPLLILAGAGSGKTTVLVNRIANLIRFGKAYNSSFVSREPTDYDIDIMTRFCEGDKSVDLDSISDVLSVQAAKPWQILAITFTNKAANELKERLSVMLGNDAEDIFASTFHSACARILRRHGELLGFSSHFTIYDTDDSKRSVKECQRVLGIDDKFLSHKSIMNEISRAKDQLISPAEYISQNQNDIRLSKIGQVYKKYQELLVASDAMDFDDIIVNTVKLLEKFEEVRDYYQKKFKYVLIDEYQDTNHAQYRLCSILAGGYGNICVVGDDDQSIYRFRGATIENILSFENQYNDAKVIRLEQNYRSTQNILDAANAVISNNEQRKGKNLWTAAGKGDKLTNFTAYDEQDESRNIADIVLNNVASGKRYSDHAVLYRMNAQTNAIETAFVRMGIPYRVIGGHRFYERKEIRDALAYLTVISNPSDNIRLRRIINEPKRGIGDTTISSAADIADGLGVTLYEVLQHADEYPKLSRAQNKIAEFVRIMDNLILKAEELPISDLFELAMRETHYIEGLANDVDTYQDRLENIHELLSNIKNYETSTDEPSLNGFLEEVALMTDIDNYDTDSDSVVLMTIHSAKGLEFPIVFLPGMEEGIFPGMQSMFNPADVEEERRLAYVAITRAKEKLYIFNTRTRMLFGSTSHNSPSRFVNEIPKELIEFTGRNNPFGARTQQSVNIQKNNERTNNYAAARSFTKPQAPKKVSDTKFKIGDTVVHKTFGTGLIISITPMANDTLLEIAFSKAGTKRLMANYANLTIPE